MVAAIARLYDPAVRVREAGLAGAAFAPSAQLREVLQAESRFGQPGNRMVLASNALDRPFERYNEVLADILLHGANETRDRIRTRQSFAHAVAALLRGWLHETRDEPDGGELQRRVCARYGISRWTLRRRLEAEQTRFQDVLMRARMDEARQLLRHTRLPIREIGERVGYASISAFTRSFTRACGSAPSHYRGAGGGLPG